ncbi:MAG TPA: energy transducer TonB [Flavisolibacter sp.]
MTSNEILKADMLDILFDNRNKMYGAYPLRKNYPQRLLLSMAIAFSFIIVLLILISSGNNSENITALQSKEVTIIDLILPPEEKKPEPPRPARQTPVTPPSQQAYTNNIRIVNRDVTNPMVLQDQIINVSDMNFDGPEVPMAYPPVDVDPEIDHSPGNSTDAAVEPPIQREPEFPGGMQAWIRFLTQNLQVPGELATGERNTVLIRFHVSKDGTVTDFEVLKSGGNIYDKEVIRVLKRMPKWKPAIQNNLPVSRAFTQPVTFVGQEE